MPNPSLTNRICNTCAPELPSYNGCPPLSSLSPSLLLSLLLLPACLLLPYRLPASVTGWSSSDPFDNPAPCLPTILLAPAAAAAADGLAAAAPVRPSKAGVSSSMVPDRLPLLPKLLPPALAPAAAPTSERALSLLTRFWPSSALRCCCCCCRPAKLLPLLPAAGRCCCILLPPAGRWAVLPLLLLLLMLLPGGSCRVLYRPLPYVFFCWLLKPILLGTPDVTPLLARPRP